MVLPAPVSPVMTVRPGPSSCVEETMTPSELIRSSSSIGVPVVSVVPAPPLRRAAPALDGQVELRDEAVGERRLVQPDQPDRAFTAAHLDARPRSQVDR